jgi:hypothetical protein
MSSKLIADLIYEYVRNPDSINDEQIKIVKDGFDLMKRRFELDVFEHEFMLRTFKDKRKRTTEKGIGRIDQIIGDLEVIIKEGRINILETDKMRNAFEDRIKIWK